MKNTKYILRGFTRHGGFTMFFAVLVASLALAIGLAILDLMMRQLQLSEVTSQSQYAMYAADTGAECALYWDNKYNTNKSAFATSSVSSPPTSGVFCENIDIAAHGTPPSSSWSISSGANAATTTFTLTNGTNACTTVQVGKSLYLGFERTTILSYGHNTCNTSASNLVEREIKVSY